MLVRSTLKTEFRRIDPATARIVLVDMAPRVLGTVALELSEAAKHRLEKLGVEALARTQRWVEIDADGVVVGGRRYRRARPLSGLRVWLLLQRANG